MPIVEYPAGSPFPGVIGRTADESSPAWPASSTSSKARVRWLARRSIAISPGWRARARF